MFHASDQTRFCIDLGIYPYRERKLIIDMSERQSIHLRDIQSSQRLMDYFDEILPVRIILSTSFVNTMYDRRRLCDIGRSEEHTSELQSRGHLVCRLLLVI